MTAAAPPAPGAQAAQDVPSLDEIELASLIARYYRREIGVLMQQAEHWAGNGKPLAVHHRLRKADAYYQIVALMDRDDPFGFMRSEVGREPIKPLGVYPPSAELYQYRDPAFVAQHLAPVAQSAPMTINLAKLREAARRAMQHPPIHIPDGEWQREATPATILALIERLEKADADNARLNSIIDGAAYELSIWQGEHYDCDCPPHRDCGCKKLSEIRSLLTRVTHDAALSHAKEGQR